LTSESLGLGESDADARWIGIRRHQAALLIMGVALVGEGIITARVRVGAISAGVALLLCVVPTGEGRTVGEQLAIGCRFFARQHWRSFIARQLGEDVVLWFSGEVAFRGYELVHRGRLDLSGRDAVIAQSLAELADTASAATSGQHFSVHVARRGDSATTLLAVPVDAAAPDGWTLRNDLALEMLLGLRGGTSTQVLERPAYVRTPQQLVRIYRVRDFSFVPEGRGLLETLLRSPGTFDVSLHIDVVSAAAAQRLASRAVHRVGSDEEMSRAAGFRRTARSSRNYERMAQRERYVASGRALLRVAVYIVARADSLDELQRRGADVWRHARDAGLRLDRGRGLQASWYRSQLPGGPGW
jgi:hypothetical protein